MKIKNFLIGFLILGMTACGGIKTYTDYDETIDFTPYKSYAFFEDMDTGLDSLDYKRFTKALNKEFHDKDFESNNKNPDFRVNFYGGFEEVDNQHLLGIGIGTMGHHVGGNISGGIPINSRSYMLILTVELVDAKSNKLYWQTDAEGKFKPNMPPEKRRAFFEKIATKILKDYPPKQ